MNSPCIEVCLFDGRTGWCRACGRTKDECRVWKKAQPQYRRKLEAELPRRVALVLGNETDGLSPDVRALCDGLLAIPMEGGVESLNVASAGAVAAFELRRRRR